jgi:hypothetical protein
MGPVFQRILLIGWILAFAIPHTSFAAQEQRTALVIGNADYQFAP